MKLALAAAALALAALAQPAAAATMFPTSQAKAVNPDTQLKLTFNEVPKIGKAGKVRIYDAANDKLVDTLDMSIPAGPTERATGPAATAPYLTFPYPYDRSGPRLTNANTKPGTPSAGATATDGAKYQLTIIGGFTDGFHFYPITVDGKTATLHPHHDLLQYGHSYYVQVDAGVIAGFDGVKGKAWTFTTKAANLAPKAGAANITVSADGKADFSTVQAAVDFVPDHSKKRITIRVKNGLYEEIIYFRNKDNLTILGQDQGKTLIRYANNETLNPHPVNLATNEMAGTFPSRRAAVTVDNSKDVHLINLTLETSAPGQSEGLLIAGDRDILSHVTVIGGGDALQANGRIYVADSFVSGTGDTVLSRGTVYFERTTFFSTRVFMWIRNTDKTHGNVFKDCVLRGTLDPTEIARSPYNRKDYPFAEAVLLNSTLINISPEGWGEFDKGGKVRLLEYGSKDAAGRPIDVSHRPKGSIQLDKVKDAQTIANYSNPEWVLAGWKPELEKRP